MFGWLRRKRRPADPSEVAERERLRRESVKARQRGELEKAKQRGGIDVNTPPPGGFVP